MKQLVIDRSRWLRGEGPVKSQLLRDDGKMCCMGFLCILEGNTEEEIFGLSILNERNEFLPPSGRGVEFHPWGVYNLANLAPGTHPDSVYSINDSRRTSDAEKEALLAPIFAANGIEVSFIN